MPPRKKVTQPAKAAETAPATGPGTEEAVMAQDAPTQPDAQAEPNEPETPEVPEVQEGTEQLAQEIEGIWVTSKPKSFRRAGFRFDQAGMGIALEALEEGQLEQLEAETNLVVERCVFTDNTLTKPEAE